MYNRRKGACLIRKRTASVLFSTNMGTLNRQEAQCDFSSPEACELPSNKVPVHRSVSASLLWRTLARMKASSMMKERQRPSAFVWTQMSSHARALLLRVLAPLLPCPQLHYERVSPLPAAIPHTCPLAEILVKRLTQPRSLRFLTALSHHL